MLDHVVMRPSVVFQLHRIVCLERTRVGQILQWDRLCGMKQEQKSSEQQRECDSING